MNDKTIDIAWRKIKLKNFAYEVDLGEEAVFMYNRYIALQQYPVPVTTLTQPSRAIISKDDEVELIEIDLSAASELSKLRISSERDQLDKIILDLKKYDTACRYGQAWIEGDQIKGVRIKFNHPNKYSYILIKDFISALNKKKMYNDTNIVCVSFAIYFYRLKIQKKGKRLKLMRMVRNLKSQEILFMKRRTK